MKKTLEDISREAVNLPRNQRLALARFLLEIDAPAEDPEVEALWHTEILKRAEAVEEGTEKGIPYAQVLNRVDAALKR